MEPSIEITYDPTIKVRGITEELFKQQPEGKFVLKPFTIISKKVYENFNERSLSFRYLVKFLKKKSRNDSNFIFNVFSESSNSKNKYSNSLFRKVFEKFKKDLVFFYKYLRPFKFISKLNYLIETENIINKILSEDEKKKIEILKISRLWLIRLFVSGIFLFIPQLMGIYPAIPFLIFALNILWAIAFGTTFYLKKSIYRFLELNPNLVNMYFEIFFTIRKIIYIVETYKVNINKKIFLLVNSNIYYYFDSATSQNFIDYLLKSIFENKNIYVILHAQDSDFIKSIKTELDSNFLNNASCFLLENDVTTDRIQILDNSEFVENNFPMDYDEYEWRKELEEAEKKNQQLEREKKEYMAREIQSAKLNSMSITTSGLAHEIRNPLSIVQLVIENLRLEKNLNKETLMEDLDTIQKQISRVFKLTETFQKYSSKRNLTKKSIDRQITNSLSFFEQRLISNKIEVNYDKPEERIGAIEVSEELSIVIENLISNSIDALSENKDGIIKIRMLLEDTKLVLLFSDNGHGVSDEDKDKIFTPLFTTKGPGKGTGLGLWLCYTIVKENLNGEIRIVDSEPNLNTTFRISLPIGGD